MYEYNKMWLPESQWCQCSPAFPRNEFNLPWKVCLCSNDLFSPFLKWKKSLGLTIPKNVPFPLLLPKLPNPYKRRWVSLPIFNALWFGHMILQLWLREHWTTAGYYGSCEVTYRLPWPSCCRCSLFSPAAATHWYRGARAEGSCGFTKLKISKYTDLFLYRLGGRRGRDRF